MSKKIIKALKFYVTEFVYTCNDFISLTIKIKWNTNSNLVVITKTIIL